MFKLVSVEFCFKCISSNQRNTYFALPDEGDPNSKRSNILKNLPSRQLSLWKRKARKKMQDGDRSRANDYEAVNSEDSDEDGLDETKSTTRKKKFGQTEPLSERLVKLRKRR